MAQIRGQFPLPFTSPQATGTANAVMLPPGGIYYPLPGEYLVETGAQTVLEWFDPTNYVWRCVAGPMLFEQMSCDGTNYRLVNMSGCVAGALVTNAGSGGTNGIGPVQTGTTMSIAAPAAVGLGNQAQGYVIVGGSVPVPTVTQAGSGFLVPPLIVCDPPPIGGVQATFTCSLTAAGAIASPIVQVNPGAGYTSIPQFYIVPQWQFYNGAPQYPGAPGLQPGYPPGLINPANAWGGSPYQANLLTGPNGALLTGNALTGSGTLTGIVITYYGGNYIGTDTHAITFGGTSLGAAAATSIMSFCLTGTTVTGTGGTAAVVGSPAITSYGLVANVSNNNTYFPRPGRGIVTTAAGAFTVEDPGFGLQGAVTTLNAGGTTLITVPQASLGGRADVSILQAMVQ